MERRTGEKMKQEYLKEAPPIIQEFLAYMENVRGRSGLTVDEYYRDLRTFFRFILKEKGEAVPDSIKPNEIDISCVDIEFIKKITFTDILLFLNYCRIDRKNSAATISRKTSSLKSYFRYLTLKVNKISNNPTEALDPPKKPKTVPKYLTLEESLRFLESIDGKYKERDYCMMIFFLNCGMRISELCGINLSDINNENMLKLRGKGNKERVLYLNNSCVSALNDYLKVRPTENVKDKNALFISGRNCRITPKGVQYVLDKRLQKIGLDGQGYSPHKLRHTAATLMYQKGNVDIRTLQAILGHSTLSTTQIYTHIADDQVIEGLKANPLADNKIKKTNKK